MSRNRLDYEKEIGKKYKMLTVLEYIGKVPGKGAIYRCKCDCGNIVEVLGTELRGGIRKSCGCARHLPRKPKADFCVVCGSPKVYVKNMCRRCYFKQWKEKKREEFERYL